MRTKKYFLKNFEFFFGHKKLKKPFKKLHILMAVGRFFFSAAPTVQNSPELHFHFINSPTQSSVLKSVLYR